MPAIAKKQQQQFQPVALTKQRPGNLLSANSSKQAMINEQLRSKSSSVALFSPASHRIKTKATVPTSSSDQAATRQPPVSDLWQTSNDVIMKAKHFDRDGSIHISTRLLVY
ncbi:hypothetical protein H5410_027424 [Solanum commersonii]|uniref:Uncharacterized protein n=1 Tax=Solanum commersonii TaxID=4109 RepID=A0A9J5Z3C1_SOLCO|nr:hypothetical protein H5410_027424 [Solanum commersonii]